MKKLFTLFLASIVWSSLLGQKIQHESKFYDVYFGPKQERQFGTSVDVFLGADDEQFFTYFKEKNKIAYGKYSNELKKLKTNTVEPPKEKATRNTEMYYELGDDIFEFYSLSDKKTKTNKLFCRTLDKELLKPNKDDRELFSLTGDSYYKQFKNAFTQGAVSPDETKFLVAFKLPEEEDRYKRFRFMVFDNDFNLLWQADRKFVVDKNLKFNLFDTGWFIAGGSGAWNTGGSYDAFQLGNNGEILTWGIQDKGRDFEKENRFETFVFKITEKDMIHAKVGFGDKKIMESSIHLNKDGRVMISGFYNNDIKAKEGGTFISFSNKLKFNLVDGAFLSYWDIESGEPTHMSFEEFSDEFTKTFWSERRVKRYEKDQSKDNGKTTVGMSHYDLDHIVEKEDGSVILVGESTYTKISNTSSGQSITYIYGNIIVINVDPKGNILWSKKIPKSQEKKNSTVGLGYELAYTKDRLYFLYNDNFKNLAKGWDGAKVYTFRGGDNPVTMAVCDLTNDGEISREQVWTTEKAGGMFQPGSRVDQLFDDETIIYIQGGKGTQRMIRVKYK